MKNLLKLSLALLALAPTANAKWKPAAVPISTPWAAQVNPANPRGEYPRPQLRRKQWQSLNGLWQYAIRPASATNVRVSDGQILVPFCVESSLSGVGRKVGKDNALWYERTFSVPSEWTASGQRVMLNFGAVDWQCQVFVNGQSVGSHEGGYTSFAFDITPYLRKSGRQTLRLRVYDPTNAGYQPTGKQRIASHGIWYTSVTGIWQTVWIEPVAQSHIEALYPVADIHTGTLTVGNKIAAAANGQTLTLRAYDGSSLVAQARVTAGQPAELHIANAKLWSPDAPNLYRLEADLTANGKTIDHAESYAAMRQIGTQRDARGYLRLTLNDKPLFQLGPLDQGYWPDGLYTAPTYEAMKFDIVKTKDWGLNLIRKHMKVEPDVWYAACDSLGILVWQDMPMGELVNDNSFWKQREWFDGRQEQTRSAQSEQNYRHEWKDVVEQFKFFPCIVVWTPFNEAWGQFKTVEIAEWTKLLDPTRLVNSASGGNNFHTGDILDIHHYPKPELNLRNVYEVMAVGEYGGVGLPVKGHMWQEKDIYQYQGMKSQAELTSRYIELAKMLERLIPQGCSAGVYTQTTDVEAEINGYMTYDRKVIKMDEAAIRKANQDVINSLK